MLGFPILIFISIIFILVNKSNESSIDTNIEMENPKSLLLDGTFIDSFSNKIKIIGRKFQNFEKNLTIFDWSGTSILFDIEGKCDKIFLNLKSNGDYFSLYYNEIFQYKVKTSKENLIKLEPTDQEDYSVKLLKATEPLMTKDYVEFKGIRLIGNCTLKDNPVGKRGLIEFIGDSITCGLGVEEKRGNKNTIEKSSIDNAYPGILSRKVNMDYYAICASGMGVTHSSGYNGVGLISQYYNKDYFFTSTTNLNIYTKPDMIIICLGTNDWLYIKDHFYEQKMIDNFIQEFKIFLLQVRYLNSNKKNGKLVPILVFGLGENTAAAARSKEEMQEISRKMNPWIEKAVSETNSNKIQQEIYYKTITADPIIDYDDDDNFGVGDHWSIKGSEKFANGAFQEVYNFTKSYVMPRLNESAEFTKPNFIVILTIFFIFWII